ncbi:MAG: hypothetical protein NVS3B20_01010 [Polyangiales bacterium]
MGLFNASFLDGAKDCVNNATCDVRPASCLHGSVSTATPSEPQKKLVKDFCQSCVKTPGQACEDAFFRTDGAPNALSPLILPLGDSIVTDIDAKCIGKPLCPASFAACVTASSVQAIASIPVDAAACLTPTGPAGDAGPDSETNNESGPPAETSVVDAPKETTSGKKRVFVTAGKWNGDLRSAGKGASGVEGADNLCNASALGAGLPGTFRAWLSTTGEGAPARIAEVGPWYLVDGTKVFSSKASFKSGPLTAIKLTEKGDPKKGGDDNVWTGTNADLTKGNECYDWTSSKVINIGLFGYASVTTGQWTEVSSYDCFASHSLYCFEQ